MAGVSIITRAVENAEAYLKYAKTRETFAVAMKHVWLIVKAAETRRSAYKSNRAAREAIRETQDGAELLVKIMQKTLDNWTDEIGAKIVEYVSEGVRLFVSESEALGINAGIAVVVAKAVAVLPRKETDPTMKRIGQELANLISPAARSENGIETVILEPDVLDPLNVFHGSVEELGSKPPGRPRAVTDEQLAEIREKANELPYEQIAAEYGVSVQTIAKYVDGTGDEV
jgi:hypothetical protein